MTDLNSLADPCALCDDSGYVETARGGIWTGENIVTSHTVCDCPCGGDLRREQALRALAMKGGA